MSMHASKFHIRSSKFPVLQEDLDECCNPGTYGKALADYLQEHLEARGYEICFTIAEDFGWWMDIKTPLFVSANIALIRSHEGSGLADFAISVDDTARKWSWRRFRFVDLSSFQAKLASDVRAILTSDPEIEFVADNIDHYPINDQDESNSQSV